MVGLSIILALATAWFGYIAYKLYKANTELKQELEGKTKELLEARALCATVERKYDLLANQQINTPVTATSKRRRSKAKEVIN